MRAPVGKATQGEYARGAHDTWHLARNTEPGESGGQIAAYLGKGEPSWTTRHGRLQPNKLKPRPGPGCEGPRTGSGKYDTPQGKIEGSEARYMRFGVARSLKTRITPLRAIWSRSAARAGT